MAETQREHEQALARTQARAEAFRRSPLWFTVWDWGSTLLNIAFWLGFWALVAQCSCGGCIWHGGKHG